MVEPSHVYLCIAGGSGERWVSIFILAQHLYTFLSLQAHLCGCACEHVYKNL